MIAIPNHVFNLQPSSDASAAPAAQGPQTVWPSLKDAKEQKASRKAAAASQAHSNASDRQVHNSATCPYMQFQCVSFPHFETHFNLHPTQSLFANSFLYLFINDIKS